jgi:hypothetical protein
MAEREGLLQEQMAFVEQCATDAEDELMAAWHQVSIIEHQLSVREEVKEQSCQHMLFTCQTLSVMEKRAYICSILVIVHLLRSNCHLSAPVCIHRQVYDMP